METICIQVFLLIIVLMPTSVINKFYYYDVCLQMILDNSTMNS